MKAIDYFTATVKIEWYNNDYSQEEEDGVSDTVANLYIICCTVCC